jgi:methionyl-tRNA formyltransferase
MCLELLANTDYFLTRVIKQDEEAVTGANKITNQMTYINWHTHDAN